MADKDEDKGPATPSTVWEVMIPKWTMISTLLGGTQAMREAGTIFLPMHGGESQSNYDERLATTTLLNMVELTLDSLVGKVFCEPLKINDDVPNEIKALLSDIDLQGNNVSVFGREWFREGFAKGFADVYIDIPIPKTEPGKPRTKEDDNRERRRPFWSLLSPENVIFRLVEVVDGREMLTHVRVLETEVSRDGWGEVTKQRVRVLEPGTWSLWELRERKNKKGKGTGKKEWVQIDNGESGLDVIPIVTFYTNRQGAGFAKPPLEDLAFLNVRHWQSTSDQNNILTVARFPILAVAGTSDQAAEAITIGPRHILSTKREQGRYYYVEHTGAAIAQGWADLADLENQMANYGAEFLRKAPGNQTATARALNSAEATSPLQDAAARFIESINNALSLTAKWLRLSGEKGGTLEITANLKPDPNEGEMFKTLVDAFKEGAIDAEELRQALRERNVLGEVTRLIKRTGLQSATVMAAEAKKMIAEKPVPGPVVKSTNE